MSHLLGFLDQSPVHSQRLYKRESAARAEDNEQPGHTSEAVTCEGLGSLLLL